MTSVTTTSKVYEDDPSNQKRLSSSSSSSVTPPSCPYAKAMMAEQSTTDATQNSPLPPGLVELKDCPAFVNSGGCPFKDAKSPEQISQQLRQIPASHFASNGTFFQTLQYFHQQNGNNSTSMASCPVKQALPKDVANAWSFDQAMEEFSLAAIMGRLAEEYEEKEHYQQDISTTGSMANASTTSSTTTIPTANHKKDDTTSPPAAPASASSSEDNKPRLSDALKSGTAQAHEAAESVHFVKNFIRGQIDRELYGLLVAQLYYVYQSLEQGLNDHAPTQFPSCHFRHELYRFEALTEDLEFWHTSTPSISPATQDYLDRIDHLCRTNPMLLLSHAYTRYMGDLSGGKVLARVARRALNLKGTDGLAFYEFQNVKSHKLFKDQYRNCLNELALDESQIQALVQEANVAFLLNMRLFEELDVVGGVPGATVRPLQSVYDDASQFHATTPSYGVSRSSTDNNAPCPFAKGGSAATTTKKQGTCPWPFILMHDPATGMKAWQTWLVLGMVMMYVYQSFYV